MLCLLCQQLDNQVADDYMRRQPDIETTMRRTVVEWLVEVAEEYGLQSQTLCLCVNVMDRFLSTKELNRSQLQLLGVAAMFIAAYVLYIFILPSQCNTCLQQPE